MNKTIIFSLLISTLLIGALYTFNSTSDEVQSQKKSIFDRKGLKKHTINSDSIKLQSSNVKDYNILTYNVNLGLGIEEIDADKQIDSHQLNEIKTVAHVQVDYVSDKKLFELVIAYSKYQQDTYVDDINVRETSEYEHIQDQEAYVYDTTLVYKLQVEEESGEILSMQAPNIMESNDLIQWGTQELVNNIFPDIRSQSYFTETPVEEDSIGLFKPHLKEIQSEDIIQLEKHYDSNDYSQYVVEGIVAPTVDYNRTLFVDQNTGVVLGGDSEYEYTIGQGNTNTVKSDGEVILSSNLSQIDIEIDTSFYLQTDDYYTQEQAQNLFNFIQNSEFEFVEIQLAKFKKGENLMQDIAEEEEIEQEEKLTYSTLYSRNTDLISFTVLSQNINFTLAAAVKSTQSDINGIVYVNGRNVKTLFQYSAQHCNSFNRNYSNSIKVPLFRASWPVGGLITVPVQASATFRFGINLSGYETSTTCGYDVKPNVSAELYGDGRASLAGVVSAGLYAKGTFLDTNLTLDGKILKSSGKTDVELKGNLQSASFEFGGVYNMVTCDASKIFNFQWKNVCKIGNDKFHPFVKKSTSRIYKSFFKQTVYK